MATKTRADLVDQVLENLGVLAAGQTPPDEDFDAVDKRIDACVELLAAGNVFQLQDVDAIPLAAFLPLCDYVAARCAAAFGLAGDQAIAVRSVQAEADLRQIAREAAVNQTLTTDRMFRVGMGSVR